jgi:LPXTG-motif cell wall-anchored protein
MNGVGTRLFGALIAVLTATAVVLGGLAVLAFAAEGDEDDTPTNAITTEWKTGHVVMDWQGNASEVARDEESFASSLVAVPGDRVQRTVTITNDGPSEGVLGVNLLDLGLTVPEGSTNTDLETSIDLYWALGDGQADSVRFAAARAGSVSFLGADQATHTRFPLSQVNVAQGESIDLTVGWEFPEGEVAGRRGDAESVALSFDVQLVLRAGSIDDGGGTTPPVSPDPTPPSQEPTDLGDSPSPPSVDPDPDPSGSGSATGVPPTGTDGSSGGSGAGSGAVPGREPGNSVLTLPRLPYTGAQITGMAIIAGAAAGLGLILLLLKRRKDRSDQD